MRVRALLLLTSVVSLVAGAAVVYIALTVPQDVAAGRMLRDARTSLGRGENIAARSRLEALIQQYPRTDAAAAAAVALIEIVRRDELDLQSKCAVLAQTAERQQHTIDTLAGELGAISTARTSLAAAPVVPTATPSAKPPHAHITRHRRRRR